MPDPAPITFPPSDKFIGADGAWSTFPVNVGNPAQNVQLVVSTAQAAAWVVNSSACGDSTTSSCAANRGGLFTPSKSSSWFRKEFYALNAATKLGYGGQEQNGTYGFDKIASAAGGSNFSVDHQVVAAIATPKFWLGSLGLAPQVIDYGDSSDTSPSFLGSLKDQRMIPSLSYAYTAGAYYKDKNGAASLTLGGYDAARFQKNGLQFNVANDKTRALVSGLSAVTYKDSNGEKPLLQEGILTNIDSTVPYLWLPRSSCSIFESILGITWDPIANVYLVNDTTHAQLVKTNPTFTFSVAPTNTQGSAVNITFPYAAFDLNITAPLVRNDSRYFPLQRAPDDQSATLGRAFLQEAYLIANFETNTFSISQATHDGTASNIVPIKGNVNGTTSSAPTGSGNTSKKSGGFGTGAIAGVAIAIALVGIIVAFTFWFLWRRKRQRNAESVHQNFIPPVETKTMPPMSRNSHDDPEPKKFASNVHVQPAEDPLTPPLSEMAGSHGFDHAGPSSPQAFELPANRFSTIEMDQRDFSSRPELASPGLQALRSELSTPEPVFAQQELPTPDPSHELDSPPLRPIVPRVNSIDSGGSLNSDVIHGLGLHGRSASDDSTKQLPRSLQREPEETIESPILGQNSHGATGTALETSNATLGTTSSTGRPSNLGSVSKRPVHTRQDSDTWQTRLNEAKNSEAKKSEAVASPASRFSMIERKDSNNSEVSSLVSPVSVDSPTARKPVPIRSASDDSLMEEDEHEGGAKEHHAKAGKDEKAKQ